MFDKNIKKRRKQLKKRVVIKKKGKLDIEKIYQIFA